MTNSWGFHLSFFGAEHSFPGGQGAFVSNISFARAKYYSTELMIFWNYLIIVANPDKIIGIVIAIMIVKCDKTRK